MASASTTSLSPKHIFGVRLAVSIFALALLWPVLRPLIVTSLIGRSDLYAVYGRYDDARRYLARAQFLDPTNDRILAAQAFTTLGGTPEQMRASRARLEPLAATQPTNGNLWLDLAIMDTRLHDFPAAQIAIDHAMLTLHDPTTKKLADVIASRR